MAETARWEIKIDSATKKLIKDLQEKCHNDLMTIISSIAAERNSRITSVMNIETIKQMSIKKPSTKEEMLELPHVTKANFEKVGKQLLDITSGYGAETLGRCTACL